MSADTGSANARRCRCRAWFTSVSSALVVLAGTHGLASATSLSFSDFQVTTWTARDGVPLKVWAIGQTNDGWLWFGGPNGLYRFDGWRFEPVRFEAGLRLRSRVVSTLRGLHAGGLLIGTAGGDIVRLDNGHATVEDTEEAMAAGRLDDFVEDDGGVIWAPGFEGLMRFDGSAWRLVADDWGYPGGAVVSLHRDRSGTVWVLNKNEILRLDGGSRRFQATGVRSLGLNQIMESPDGKVWAYDVNDGLLLLGKSSPLTADPTPDIQASTPAFFDRQGRFWQDQDDEATHLPAQAIRGSQSIDPDLSVGLQDRDGNIWFGSANGKVYRMREPLIATVLPLNSALTGVVEDTSGVLWMGARSARLDLGLWKFDTALQHMLPQQIKTVSALGRGADGSIWVSDWEHRLVRVRNDRLDPVRDLPPLAQGEDVIGITPDCAGGTWLTIASIGLLRLGPEGWQKNGDVSGLPALPPTVLSCDVEDRLWLGYPDGRVLRVDGRRVDAFGEPNGLRVGPISALSVGSRYVAVGEALGLALLQNQQFRTMRPLVENAFDRPTGIAQAPSGDLWINNAGGLARVQAEEIARWAASEGETPVAFRPFDASDGYPGPGISVVQSTPNLAIDRAGRAGSARATAWACSTLPR